MTPNGVFGSKMMWGYLRELVPQLSALLAIEDSSLPAVLAAAFPQVRYIWLTRRDKVRQGISFYRALETKVWRSTDVPAGLADNPAFDFLAIDRLVQLSTWEDESWREYFQEHAISPLIVSYENLAQAPEDVVRQILAYLDLPAARLPDLPWRHQRQADALTDEWVERYHTLKGC